MSPPIRPARQTPLAERLRERCRERPLVVGHRGAAGTHAENTLPSFTAALDAGADSIEFDIHETKEGALVCIHDATLDRTTDARAQFGGCDLAVAQHTLAQIARLDAGSWRSAADAGATVPSLADALALITPRAVAMIEHKGGRPETVVALLRELDLLEQVLLQSFDWDWVAAVQAIEPRLTLGALASRPLGAARLRRLPETGASFVHQAWDRVPLEEIALLQRAGYLLCVYTADPDLALVGAAAAGADMITTNLPARLRALVDQGHARRGRRA